MKKGICFLLLMFVHFSFGQVKLEGVVKDSLNNPLELANVVVLDQKTSSLESYAITDQKGNYKLELGKNGTYSIQVSYVGMKTFEEVLITTDSDIKKDYFLVFENSNKKVSYIKS